MKSEHPYKGSGVLEKIIAITSLIITICAIGVIVKLPNETIANASSIINKGSTNTGLKSYEKDNKPKEASTKPLKVTPQIDEAKKEKSELYLSMALAEAVVKTVSENKEIEYSTNIIKTNALKEGERKVIKKGESGLKVTNKSLTYKGDYLYSQEVSSVEVVKKPVNEVVLVGVESKVPIFSVPSKGRYSSYYGERWGRMHKGVDIAASIGTSITASEGGEVTFSGDRGSYGKCIIIKHKNGYETLYAHTSKLIAKKGEVVHKGQVIAEVGNTGRSTGPHLHFEVKLNGKAKDPMNYLK